MEMRNFPNNSVGDGLQITRDDKRTSVYAQGAVLSLEAYQMPPFPAFYSFPPGQNGCHFTDDIFTCIFVNEKSCIRIKISMKFVSKGPIDNNPALV